MIKRMFTNRDLKIGTAQFFEKQKTKVVQAMNYVGIQITNDARKNKEYADDTGALRASTGYLVANDQNAVIQDFEGSNSEGVEIGRSVALSQITEPDPILIVTAGMEYAGDVEKRGYAVLTKFIDPEKATKTIKKLLGLK